MKQDKISEVTRRAIEAPMEFTKTLMEKTEKVKNPSLKVDKIGRTIGTCVGAGLLLTGSVGLLFGKTTWAIGSLSVGTITFISNIICLNKNKKQS